ncbi:MAG TPA: serine hydrolase domain-containing protein [Candidatus Sulfotelmatobacter sp.]|nr:serine hydrolase domain-containing protein [Candidatus Sulfotelmatobacter sp.]
MNVPLPAPASSAINRSDRELFPGKRIRLNRTDSASLAPLIPAWQSQDRHLSSAFSVVETAIGARAFPGASVAVTYRGKLVALKAFGRFTHDPHSPRVTPATLFDLASISKVVATTTMAMILYERGLLDLDAPVVGIVPEFGGGLAGEERDPRRGLVTFRMLLGHSSGLPAYEKLFLKARGREQLLQAAFITPLATDPGTRAVYSDIGFILLGQALERLAAEPLDRFCQREIFGPLAMAHTTYNPPPECRAHVPPTQDDRTFRKHIVQGEVQDENASVLGGVAPHAGVFSTAEDLARFAHAMISGGHPILRPETVALFTRREGPAGSSRALGWDTPSAPSQSGKYFSAQSYGHLGYTGTSLWIDPVRQLSVILLTNRTWPDADEVSKQAIKKVRPRFHDAVVEALDAAG